MSLRFIFSPFLLCFFFSPSLWGQEELSPKDSLWDEVACIFNETFDYKAAIVNLEGIKEILQISEELSISDRLAEAGECLFYQAYCSFELRDWECLNFYLEQYLELGQKLAAEEGKEFVSSDYHYMQGMYLFQQGTYELAEAYYKETLRIIEYQNFSFRVEDVYHNLAIVYQKMGDFQQAIPYLQFSSLDLENKVEIAIRQNNLALCQMELGNYEQAEKILKESRVVINQENQHAMYAEAINGNRIFSGKLYNRISQPQAALSFLNQVQFDQISPAQKIETLFEKGIAFLQLGETEKATEFHQEALFGGASEIFTKHPNLALCLKELGNMYLKQGDIEKSISFFDKSLAVLRTDSIASAQNLTMHNIQAKPLYLSSLLAKAQALKEAGSPKARLEALLQASEILEELILQDLQSNQSKYFWINQAKEVYETIIETMFQLKLNEEAWEFIQKGKGVLLTQSINQLQVARDDPKLDSLVRRRKGVQLEIDYLETQLSTTEKEAGEPRRIEKIILLKKEQENIDQIILDSFPGFYNWEKQNDFLTVKTARNRLSSTSDLLLDMFVGKENIYLLGLTQKELFLEKITYPQSLKSDLLTFRNLLGQLNLEVENYTLYCDLGYQLYQEVFQKSIANSKTKINKILFIPDEEFNYLPIAALLTAPVSQAENAVRYDLLPYLIKEVDVSYEYATKLLALAPAKSKVKEKDNMLMAYAPRFTGEGSITRGGNALLYNMEEAQAIHDILGGKLNLAEQATKASFLQDIRQYRIAHLATHAYCNDSLPFNSHIQFSADSLRLFEIVNLPHQLDLIVLSACETGRGKLSRGEGISSLARGFINSGCPSIVTTMWQVNDRQTSKLMTDFYRALAEGAPKSRALAQAQRNYLSNSLSASLAHPFYWAPFVQIGNSEPIMAPGWPRWTMLLLAAGVLLLLLLGFWKRKTA